MLRFILRRLLLLPPILLLVNFFGYAYAYLVLPLRASRIPYVLHLALPGRGPLLSDYLDYLWGVLRLDLGEMALGQAGRGLAEDLGRAIPASLGLLGIALVVSTVAGLGLGLLAARTDPPRRKLWLPLLSTLGMAMPSFYIGVLLLLVVFLYVLNFPGRGLPLPAQGFGWDLHLLLPTLALMVRPTVQIAQATSGLLVDELGQRYVVTARSVGHRWEVIRRRHVLRNVLAPVVLTIAGSLRLLVGELILVEWLFRWPGMGYLFARTLIPPEANVAMVSAIRAAAFLNPAVVSTILTVLAGLFLLTDLIASALVRALDPRLRAPVGEVGNV